MSSPEPDLNRYKPANTSQEEWNEIISELQEKKTDNQNHHTVQLKVKQTIKYLGPVILLPLLGIGYLLAMEFQAILYSIIGIIGVIAFLYYASVEQGAGED